MNYINYNNEISMKKIQITFLITHTHNYTHMHTHANTQTHNSITQSSQHIKF